METRLKVRSLDSHLSPEQFRGIPRLNVVAILDNLRSAFNVGSIIRTADCALAEEVVLCGITAHPPHRKLEKTSLGALPYVPWKYEERVTDAILSVKERGMRVFALELTNQSRVIWETEFPDSVALILGNEALGVSGEALEMADEIVEIPVMGFKNSINVSVAFGVVVYEIQRQRWNRISRSSWVRRTAASSGTLGSE